MTISPFTCPKTKVFFSLLGSKPEFLLELISEPLFLLGSKHEYVSYEMRI